MDSIRVTWDAENDVYVLHVPGQKDMVVEFGEMQDLHAAMGVEIEKTLA